MDYSCSSSSSSSSSSSQQSRAAVHVRPLLPGETGRSRLLLDRGRQERVLRSSSSSSSWRQFDQGAAAAAAASLGCRLRPRRGPLRKPSLFLLSSFLVCLFFFFLKKRAKKPFFLSLFCSLCTPLFVQSFFFKAGKRESGSSSCGEFSLFSPCARAQKTSLSFNSTNSLDGCDGGKSNNSNLNLFLLLYFVFPRRQRSSPHRPQVTKPSPPTR